MQLQYAFLCEAATVSPDGKLNILGIFNKIASDAFPLELPRIVMVLSCKGQSEEFGLHPLVVRIISSDGHDVVDSLELQIEIPPEGGSANVIGEYNGIEFRSPGHYSFEVTADKQFLASLSLEIAK